EMLRPMFETDQNMVRFSAVSKLDEIEDSQIFSILNEFYSEKNFFYRFTATLLNAMYTQQTLVGMISRPIMESLIKKDKNNKLNSCDSARFNEFMNRVKAISAETGKPFLAELREPVGRSAGLYELKWDHFIDILAKRTGIDLLEAKKQNHIDWYD